MRIGEMLANHGKNGGLAKVSPLQIHATVSAHSKNMPMEDTKYEKEEIKRLRAEIKGIDKVLDEWVPEDVAARAKKSLELERDAKMAHLAECRIRMKQHEAEHEEVDQDDESEEKED